ncbi:hypothetical protein FOL47_010567 [Perkinsus chesapeaki]|uniref:Uncharacterized protein n=1 Tax=Perkinsus chesapeaki TaxID=330153 RepID=A0A7J6L2G1_PERCH|nr:hypothetical protein FOL47_010567 [Perkinsus chesapeaki]
MAAVPVRRRAPRSPNNTASLSEHDKHVTESAATAVPKDGVKQGGTRQPPVTRLNSLKFLYLKLAPVRAELNTEFAVATGDSPVRRYPSGSGEVAGEDRLVEETYTPLSFSWPKALLATIVLLVCVAAMDVALSRMHYHYLFRYEISPAKAEALKALSNVNATVQATNISCTVYDPSIKKTVNDCSRSVCMYEALQLADKRQQVLQTVRQTHIIGRITAEIFDRQRGVDQAAKPEILFRTKSCERIIDSVDHSNRMANMFSIAAGIGSLIGFWLLFCAILRPSVPSVPESEPETVEKVQRRRKLD